jgi:ribosomal protein S21
VIKDIKAVQYYEKPSDAIRKKRKKQERERIKEMAERV